MSVPLSQMWAVGSHILKHKLRRHDKYPLVLMIEPLFKCNLACAGCGKIQYPPHIMKEQLSVDDCIAAVEECPTPVVTLLGGEPLLHPHINEIVEALVDRRKFVYLCTNGVLLREQMDNFRPSKYLTLSLHLDGTQDMHDFAVCREGVYHEVDLAIREAIARGFRVTTNTTLFEGADPNAVREFFDDMMELGVEGMMISPGYAYEKAPDQDHFLRRREIVRLFRMILSNQDRGRTRWRWNQSPLFIEFLMGHQQFDCTPWGNPTYNVFGWQRPCYLLQDGYADSYEELIAETDWSKYGESSGNPKCANCMVHCGHEPSAVNATFSSLAGFWRTVLASLGRPYRDTRALAELEEERKRPHGPALVQVQLDEELAERRAREVA